MHRRVFTAALLAASLPAPVVRPLAADTDVTVSQAWSRATAGAEMPGAIFVTIHGGVAADELLGVATPVAKQAMLHRMDMSGGMMRMRMVASMPVLAGATLALGPDGDHVMLTGLSHGLHQGETFPATFRFRNRGNVTVTVRVAGPGASAAP